MENPTLGEIVSFNNPFRVFKHDDFTSFSSAQSSGGEKRVVVADVGDTGERVIVKTPRRLLLMLSLNNHRSPAFRKRLDHRRSLTESEQGALRRMGWPEDRITQETRIDWDTILNSPLFRINYNQDVIDSLLMAKIAREITAIVAEPAGVYRTTGGLLAEVYKYYEGKIAHNDNDWKKSVGLSEGQKEFLYEQYNLLSKYGMVLTKDAINGHNIIVTGNGDKDLTLVEPIVQTFDPSRVEISDENAKKFADLWQEYMDRVG